MIQAPKPGDDDEEPHIDKRVNLPREAQGNVGLSNHDPELANLKQMTRKVAESRKELQPGSVGEFRSLATVTVKSKPDAKKVCSW